VTIASDTWSGSLLEVRDLHTQFFTRRGIVRAVDGVSLTLEAGKTLGLVGESGCGKSVTALSVLRAVQEPGRVVSGQIVFQGEDILRLSERGMQKVRGRRIAMIPQDPLTALNPVLSVGDQLAEVLTIHLGMHGRRARNRGIELLERVGIPLAAQRFDAYPHQMSGGMRQRVLIAMAIACQPGLLIADEPTTALDATIQAQILELLGALTRESNMGMLLITHNLGIVAGHCDRVAIMYAGRIVETAPVRELFAHPHHRYTVGLLECVPRLDRQGKGVFHTIPGSPPDPADIPSGCPFHPRCAFAVARCIADQPQLTAATVDGDAGAYACWNPHRQEVLAVS
jgi:oligopeptide/dipeptide ABC transporter ATP-binding protein